MRTNPVRKTVTGLAVASILALSALGIGVGSGKVEAASWAYKDYYATNCAGTQRAGYINWQWQKFAADCYVNSTNSSFDADLDGDTYKTGQLVGSQAANIVQSVSATGSVTVWTSINCSSGSAAKKTFFSSWSSANKWKSYKYGSSSNGC